MDAELLIYYDTGLLMKINYDSLPYGVGPVWMDVMSNGSENLIAYNL